MIIECGNYTGNGTSQSISLSEITGTPDVVWVIRNGNYGAAFKTSAMPATETQRLGSTSVYTTAITAFSAGQFTVGDSFMANANAVAYRYVAIQDDGNDDIAVGVYTGSSGGDDREISGIGFQPEAVWVIKDASIVDRCHFSSMGDTTDSSPGIDSVSAAADYIQDLTVPANDGFEVGTLLNTDAVDFFYVAFKYVQYYIDSMRWTGTGADDVDKTITANGGTPDFPFIKDGGGYYSVYRTAENVGDAADHIHGTFDVANTIQAVSANTVQIGSSNNTNATGRTYDLFWIISHPASAPSGKPTLYYVRQALGQGA